VTILHRMRRRSYRLGRLGLGTFVLVWLSIVTAPCVAMIAMDDCADHDCPHCPPSLCHDLQPASCEAPEALDSLRAGDISPMVLAPLPAVPTMPALESLGSGGLAFTPNPPARAGPRAHLIHVQFNE